MSDMKLEESPNDLLTITESSEVSKLSESSIYDACSGKRIAHYRVSGSGKRGKILIRRSDLLAWIESQRVEAEGASLPPAPKPKPPELKHLSLN